MRCLAQQSADADFFVQKPGVYLSQKIAEEDDPERRQELASAVRNGSVVSWQHINLHGEHDFSDEKLQDSVGLRVPKIMALEFA